MKVGDLVKIRRSYSQRSIGKLAIVLKIDPYSATIHIVYSGEEQDYDVRKLEVIHESR